MARKAVLAGVAPPVRAMVIPRESCNSRLTVVRRVEVSYIPPMTPPALAPHSADALLFDLGRVVLDISFDKVMAVWAGHAGCAPAASAGRFVVDDHFRHHEIGEIDDAAFFASLRRSLGIGHHR